LSLWGIFTGLDRDTIFGLVRRLCYSLHGGSGYSFTREDVMNMGLGEAFEYVEYLGEFRKAEAEALKSG